MKKVNFFVFCFFLLTPVAAQAAFVEDKNVDLSKLLFGYDSNDKTVKLTKCLEAKNGVLPEKINENTLISNIYTVEDIDELGKRTIYLEVLV